MEGKDGEDRIKKAGRRRGIQEENCISSTVRTKKGKRVRLTQKTREVLKKRVNRAVLCPSQETASDPAKKHDRGRLVEV